MNAMERVKAFAFFVCMVASSAMYAGNTSMTDSLIRRLDEVLANQHSYIKQKEECMTRLNDEIRQVVSDEKKFMLLGKLLDECRSYNTDSSLHIAKEKKILAEKIPAKPELAYDATMNIADIMGKAGMYKEALDLMSHISVRSLPDYLHPYYYHIYRTIYGLMADYSICKDKQAEYRILTDRYRDSLLMVNDKKSLPYILTKGDQYNANGEYDKTITLLTDYYAKMNKETHDVAIVAYTLSEAYRLKGDKDKEKTFLIISAISDIQSANREYISLVKLALLLYKEGDTDHAYRYLKISQDDAVKCNARQRILEVNDIIPIVNELYLGKIRQQQARLRTSVIAISILSLLLLTALFYVYKQMKKLAEAKREVTKSNERLKELNSELTRYNEKLTEANQMISENSYLKEEYIGRYMNQCSLYLEKLDLYRKSIGRLLNADKISELKKSVKSTSFIDEELKAFYDNFDKTFLQLFPTFVDDFNNLLADGEKIVPKTEGSLTTELRIFALIRLGITDSVKIAQFLRYSVTTIYNYRTKVRNKAAGDRDKLESELMKINRN